MTQAIYYRQKVLLSLVKAAGGQLSNTDCQKLLFLLCLKTKQHYDFFPYNYGGFSHVLYSDKRSLIKMGLLRQEDAYVLGARDSFDIKKEDIEAIQSLLVSTKERGEKLLKKIYLEHPYYAHRSTIVTRILSNSELKLVEKTIPNSTEPTLFTLGYEGISIDCYLEKLISNNISLLVDVRKNPISRKFGFSGSQLEKYTTSVKVNYLHLPNLGVPTSLRKGLGSPESYNELSKAYSDIIKMNTKDIDQICQLINRHHRVVLTCFEANADLCHRHYITDHLQNKGFDIPIVHL